MGDLPTTPLNFYRYYAQVFAKKYTFLGSKSYKSELHQKFEELNILYSKILKLYLI